MRARVSAGDQDLCDLFRSPLRLSIALQAYRGKDPADALTGTLEEAKERLWDALLDEGGFGFEEASIAEVRSWLRFLAAGVRRLGRQRFWLHELHLYTTDPRDWRRFRVELAMGVGLAVGLLFGLLFGAGTELGTELGTGLVIGLVIGLGVGLSVGLSVGFGVESRPGVLIPVAWTNRWHALKKPPFLCACLRAERRAER